MSPEQKRGNLSPFERLGKYFKDAEAIEKSFPGDSHHIMRLKDGDDVYIGQNFLYDFSKRKIGIESYRVQVSRYARDFDSGDLDSQTLTFSIDENGLVSITVPELRIKIGDNELSRVNIGEIKSPVLKNKKHGAEILVDWLDKIMKEGKYSRPPMSTSNFR